MWRVRSKSAVSKWSFFDCRSYTSRFKISNSILLCTSCSAFEFSVVSYAPFRFTMLFKRASYEAFKCILCSYWSFSCMFSNSTFCYAKAASFWASLASFLAFTKIYWRLTSHCGQNYGPWEVVLWLPVSFFMCIIDCMNCWLINWLCGVPTAPKSNCKSCVCDFEVCKGDKEPAKGLLKWRLERSIILIFIN